MKRFAFAGRGREHGRRGRSVAAGVLKRFLPDGERKLDRYGGAAPLGSRQQIACTDERGGRTKGLLAREDAASRLPALQARAEQTYTFDKDPRHWATPRTRLQLLPPNPNELLRTRVTFACLFSSR